MVCAVHGTAHFMRGSGSGFSRCFSVERCRQKCTFDIICDHHYRGATAQYIGGGGSARVGRGDVPVGVRLLRIRCGTEEGPGSLVPHVDVGAGATTSGSNAPLDAAAGRGLDGRGDGWIHHHGSQHRESHECPLNFNVRFVSCHVVYVELLSSPIPEYRRADHWTLATPD